MDIVGPGVSPGPDGIQDLDLKLAGLSIQYSVRYIAVTPPGGVVPGGYAWATQPDAAGYSLAEFFQNLTTGDLYINPQVNSVSATAGTGSPPSLGGSTGNLIQLTNGDSLKITVYYQNTTYTDSFTFQLGGSIGGLTSPTDPEPPPSVTPVNVNTSVLTVQDEGQPSSVPYSYEDGMAELQVTASSAPFAASQFSNGSTLSPLVFVLSDEAGIEWDSTSASNPGYHIYAYYVSTTVADLYFPPVRNELPVNSTTAPTMTLQMQLSSPVSSVYTCQFTPTTAYNLSLLQNPLTNTTPPADPTNGYQFQQDLNSTNPVYNVIDLPAGQTIYADQPIQISQSVTIVGNGATLDFDQQATYTGGSTANWPSGDSGAIFVNNAPISHIQIELEDFTITFTGDPTWNNPSGDSPSTWDPEKIDNLPGGYTHAVIYTADNSENTHELSLVGMTVSGPPAYDTGVNNQNFNSLSTMEQGQGDLYVGEQDMPLVITGGGDGQGVSDFGTITGCTFQGGNISLNGGPWTVTNNTVLGAAAYTYSPAAFSFSSAHDVLLEGNTVSQSASPGTLFRLANLATGHSYNVAIENNSFGGNAGAIGNEASYDAYNSTIIGLNDPEVTLLENAGAGVLSKDDRRQYRLTAGC